VGRQVSATIRLDDAQLDALAARIAVHLAALEGTAATPATAAAERQSLVSAADLARLLGMSRQTIYQHAEALGGVRVGTGPRARWRFDVDTARERMRCLSSKTPDAENASAGAASEPTPARRRSRLPNGLPPAGSILTPRPRSAA
jgi:hypothetical protein